MVSIGRRWAVVVAMAAMVVVVVVVVTPMSEKEEEEEALRSRRRGKESVARRRGRWSNREIRAAVKDDGACDRKYSFPQALFTRPPRSWFLRLPGSSLINK